VKAKKLKAKLADFQRRLEAAEAQAARVDELQQMIEGRDAFNNGLAFKINKLIYDSSHPRDEAKTE